MKSIEPVVIRYRGEPITIGPVSPVVKIIFNDQPHQPDLPLFHPVVHPDNGCSIVQTTDIRGTPFYKAIGEPDPQEIVPMVAALTLIRSGFFGEQLRGVVIAKDKITPGQHSGRMHFHPRKDKTGYTGMMCLYPETLIPACFTRMPVSQRQSAAWRIANITNHERLHLALINTGCGADHSCVKALSAGVERQVADLEKKCQKDPDLARRIHQDEQIVEELAEEATRNIFGNRQRLLRLVEG